MRNLITFMMAALLSACVTPPQTDYKQVNSTTQMYSDKRELNICRDGSAADHAVLLVYFNNAYVTTVPAAILSKERLKILFDNSVSSIRITAKHKDERDVVRITVNSGTPRQLYINSTSKTNSFMPIPVPGFIVTNIKGERQVQSVSNSAFEELCGGIKEVVFAK
jgi:hypothetical protein